MSSKAKRSQAAAAAAAAAVTPQPSSSQPVIRVSIPVSPTRLSRIQEKNALAGLNDRLAAYIERNQQLETENATINKRLSTFEEESTRRVTRVTENYDKELMEARRTIDESAKERTRLDLENQTLKKDNQELRDKFGKKSKEATALQANCTQLDAKLQDATAQNNKLGGERDLLSKENKDLRDELAKVTRELETTKRQLEQEKIGKQDALNQLKTKCEELSFQKRCLEQEITEVTTRKTQEIQEVDGRLQQEYDAKLQEGIQELRKEYEERLKEARDDWEALNSQRSADLQAKIKRLEVSLKSREGDSAATTTRVETLTRQITSLEAEKNNLGARIRALEKQIDDDRQKYACILQDRDEEISRIATEKEELLQEYQDLMDIKIALDNEISTYRKLLEGEERRLSISPTKLVGRESTPATRSTPLRVVKRKRGGIFEQEASESTSQLESEALSNADIEILADDPDGYCIRLRNKSDKEVSIAGWQLIRLSGTVDTTHKFTRSAKIEPKATLTIWSSDAAGAIHEPPHNLKMKEQKWYVSDHFKTVLLDNTSKEVAVRETKRVQISTQRKRLGYAGEPEELFHQDGARGDERCVIA